MAQTPSGADAPLVQAVTAVTDTNGNASITWPTGFSGTPVLAVAVQTTVAEVHSARVTAVSSGGASVHVARSPTVGVAMNASGVTVHVLAVGAA